jgi:hypothetical protein
MPALARVLRYGCGLLISLCAISCGGGNSLTGASTGPVTPASNVVSVVVNAGPTTNSVNTLFTTVTVCLPGSTTNCQTIDGIEVDTGSYGLRLMASVLTLSLPVSTASNGNSLVECTAFVDGFSWGPVALVDLKVSGESASSVPVQLIGDSRFPNVPSDCSSVGPEEDTVAEFGANGIIGIGPIAQDCGSTCVSTAVPATYYSCTQTTCENTTVPLANQVPNPVSVFAKDNNGTIITLPNVAAGGAATVTGSLIFGIDTESNNVSGNETVLPVDPATADLTTIFDGQKLSSSFIDSGSNGFYFNDSSIASCTATGLTDFYCPASTESLSATLEGASGTPSITESFSVGDMASFESTFTAFPDLAGTNPTPGSFDWGLPFFYGRRIANAIEGYTTSVGTGPYVAF